MHWTATHNKANLRSNASYLPSFYTFVYPVSSSDMDLRIFIKRYDRRQKLDSIFSIYLFGSPCSASAKGALLSLQNGESLFAYDAEHITVSKRKKNEEVGITQMRHIGNDEIQIVWSDHYRDYDRKIMPTQFGDVIMCIYPTEPTGLYRIQIIQRDRVPSFGPLYDGAVVDEENLAGLIRNTALNAGRACRKPIKGFQYFFEERAEYLKSLIHSYTVEDTYEHFLGSIISPQPAKLQIPVLIARDMPSALRPSWRESTRRYNERIKENKQNKTPVLKDAEGAPVSNLRYSLPPRSESTLSATDV